VFLPKTAIILTHFGTHAVRVPLLVETIERFRLQHGLKEIYLVENMLPGTRSILPGSLLGRVKHLKVSGSPVLWQKEAMFNAGAREAIREGADHLIFADGDVIPDSVFWMQKIEQALEEHHWVHGGSRIVSLENRPTCELLQAEDKSAVPTRLTEDGTGHQYALRSEVMVRQGGLDETGFFGGIWAVSRGAWGEYGGWDCYNVVGGGDCLHVNRLFRRTEIDRPFYGNLRGILFNPLLRRYAETDPAWNVGCVDATLYHLWHGAIGARGYGLRYLVLVLPRFQHMLYRANPQFTREQVVDLAGLVSINGDLLLEINTQSPLHGLFFQRMATYFLNRNEIDLDTANCYLQHCGAGFTVTYRKSVLTALLRILRRLDSVPLFYKGLRLLVRLLPAEVRRVCKQASFNTAKEIRLVG
jgi:hypothetical protein